jgi:hypothetical protein
MSNWQMIPPSFMPRHSLRGRGTKSSMLGDNVPADKATTISSDKPNMGKGLSMKRHSPQIPGLEPGIKQRKLVCSTIK